jgi:metal-responsive CopG/Arc/MetJ family transcriptional regulator
MRQRISITIDEDTMDEVRTKLRSKIYRNKSHFFELAAMKLLGKNEK